MRYLLALLSLCLLPTVANAEWSRSNFQSAMDDSVTIVYSTPALNDDYRTHFLLRCSRSEGIEALLNRRFGFFVHETTNVATRIGQQKASPARPWTRSTNSDSLFHPNGRKLMKALAGSNRLAVAYDNYGYEEFIFDTTGITAVIEQLEKSCPGQKAKPASKPMTEEQANAAFCAMIKTTTSLCPAEKQEKAMEKVLQQTLAQ